MIDTVRILHRSPASTAHSRPRRQRAASSSSVSAASYDVPKTPVDAYSGLDQGRLGQNFSVLKMQDSAAAMTDYVDSTSRSKRARLSPVPSWLCNTLSTLDCRHPLRVLLPSTLPEVASYSSSSPVRAEHDHSPNFPAPHLAIEGIVKDEFVFAFSPPQAQPVLRPSSPIILLAREDGNNQTIDVNVESGLHDKLNDVEASTKDFTHSLPGVPILGQKRTLETVFGGMLPFSTPGPASRLVTATLTQSAEPVYDDAYDSCTSHLSDSTSPAIREENYIDLVPFSKPGPLIPSFADSSRTTDPVCALPPEHSNLLGAPVINPSDHSHSLFLAPIGESDQLHHAAANKKTYISMLDYNADPALKSAQRTSDPSLPLHALALSREILPISRSTASDMPKQVSIFSPVRYTEDSVGSAGFEIPSPLPDFKPFSTPGPAHSHPPCAAPFTVYFDTPAEDPCTSDPIEEADYALTLDYENSDPVDIETLGFKWERFDRKDNCITHGADDTMQADDISYQLPHTPLLPHIEETYTSPSSLGFSNSNDDIQLDESVGWILPPSPSPPERSRRSPAPRNAANASKAKYADEATRSTPRQRDPSFAPVPGVFISPLRESKPEHIAKLEHEPRPHNTGHAQGISQPIPSQGPQLDSLSVTHHMSGPSSEESSGFPPCLGVADDRNRCSPRMHDECTAVSHKKGPEQETEEQGSPERVQEENVTKTDDVLVDVFGEDVDTSAVDFSQQSYDSIESWTNCGS
ncbi:hypothetical protein AcW1_009232 [Taiwanofungus camphoratus]|nr:hypothetical protein AcW1_009232 [Antrodia cinnamomea]KAI0958484.1 hypothetical protein AcV7_004293 [Antrodia cinnamomea]